MRLVVNGRFLTQDITGVQQVAIEFVRALDQLLVEGVAPGLEVELAAPSRGELKHVPDLTRVRLRRGGLLSGHAWEQVELPVLAGTAPLLCLGNLAPVVRLLTGRAPVHTMVHDLSYKYFPQAYSRRFRAVYGTVVPLVLSRSQHVFTVSHSEAQAITEHYGHLLAPGRLVAAQNGGGEGAAHVRTSESPRALEPGHPDVPGWSCRGNRVLYVGSLTRRKNADGLIRAATRLVEEDDVEFVVIGATADSFKNCGVTVPDELAGHFTFLGQVNDRRIIEAEYRRARVLLFPSHYEASPLPPVEAMRFGCPVVAADIPSLRERCGDAAAYCDQRQVDAIVAAVRDVAGDPARWAELQRAGLARAQRYSWDSQVRTVLTHLDIQDALASR